MLRHPKIIFISFLRLAKPVITLSVAFSALVGYILKAGSFDKGWFLMYLGVLLVAASSSVTNMIQEARVDALMKRTQSRPIPAGLITPKQASFFAIIMALSGMYILWCHVTESAAMVAAVTLLWYNGIYTPLKKITPWAIIPGAVVGALPPLIGWTAAGGDLLNSKIIFVAFFFFIGQIPHFWLILLKYGKDYQNAGFPSINEKFNDTQISRLTFVWTVTTAITAIALPVFGIIMHPSISIVIVALSLILIILFAKWPGVKKPVKVERAFFVMNLYYLLIMIAIIADSLFRS